MRECEGVRVSVHEIKITIELEDTCDICLYCSLLC